MAKAKKRSMPQNGKNAASVTPASRIAQAKAAEALLLEALSAEEEKEAKTEEKTKAEEETAEETKEEGKKEVPFDAEKAEMMAILRRLMEDMGAGGLSALSEMIDKAEMKKLMGTYGLDENAAKLFLAQQEKMRALKEAEAASKREAMYAAMRQDPLYMDVDDRKAAMEAFMFRTGTTPKEAYNALFGEERFLALRREMEEEKVAKDKKAKAIPALSGGDAPMGEGYQKLTEAERWAAKSAGMTPEEYARFKYAY